MRPTVFLDIDGVLATSYQYNSNRKKWHEIYDCYRFDEKCVKVFNEIIEKTNPIIILSSDWKDDYSIEAMNEIFEWNKVNATISDFTKRLWGIDFFRLDELELCRAAEILTYKNTHDINKWVAIDDLQLFPMIDNDHFVRTPRVNEGIKQTSIKDKILKIIQSE
jgi:hypothetical protein